MPFSHPRRLVPHSPFSNGWLLPVAILGLLGVPAPPAAAPPSTPAREPSAHWPQWRGPEGNGVARGASPPLTWSERQNVRWKVELPGRGQSTPIVWGGRVFLTAAEPYGEPLAAPADAQGGHDNLAPRRRQRFLVLALSLTDGRELWRRAVQEGLPHAGTHLTAGWASASPVTDGERLYVSFGSQGIYALDLDGKLLWQNDLGDMAIYHGHGEGSSPAVWGGLLFVNWDHEGDSFLAALDARTGRERWRAPRDEITSWATPLVVERPGGGALVVTSATRRVRAYDAESGRLVWQVGGLSRNVVASPVAGNGLVFVASSYDTRAMLAIRLAEARGELEPGGGAIAWSRERDTPYVPSPLLYDGELCFLKHLQSVLTCVDAATGATVHGPRRLPGGQWVYASPVGAAGRIYVTSRDGTTAVLGHGGDHRLLATNRLDDTFAASAAIAGDALLLRGERHLYCLAEGGATSGPEAPSRPARGRR